MHTDQHGRQPENDGIWRVEISSGHSDLIIDLRRLGTVDPHQSMRNACHYINHLSFNPSGERFLFFHLWLNGGVRYRRALTSDLDGQNLCVLTNDMVSHYSWKSDSEVLITLQDNKGRFRYEMFKDLSARREQVGEGILLEDGHPGFNPISGWLLSDTYPDRYGERGLFIYDLDRTYIEMGRFYSPFSFRGESRCDLHPRWNQTGDAICFDSTHEGYRAMYVVDLPDESLGH